MNLFFSSPVQMSARSDEKKLPPDPKNSQPLPAVPTVHVKPGFGQAGILDAASHTFNNLIGQRGCTHPVQKPKPQRREKCRHKSHGWTLPESEDLVASGCWEKKTKGKLAKRAFNLAGHASDIQPLHLPG